MALNAQFWKQHFRSLYAPQIRALIEVLEARLLPTFANVEEEANTKAEKEYERLGSLPATGDNTDPAELAERASDVGQAHYEMMVGLRQGLLNTFAVVLFHIYEQHVMVFHRREVLQPAEENNAKLYQQRIFQERLQNLGVDIKTFTAWATLEELKLVANTVKHADGESAAKLRSIRPDIFEPPKFVGLSFGPMSDVFTPLSGDDLYVSSSDLSRYATAVIAFWEELFDALERP